ncbi:MAG: hypothetical protein OXP36_11420 [Gammaproteobacteria bacterium]|nr:hypothetical protein [Gammaproteobacteria bacterium]
MYGLSTDDRDFVLDMGLCQWVDAELLDEIVERSDSLRRIEAIPMLVGLLEPVSHGDAAAWRLHPLIREHCTKQRFRKTPDRYRLVNRRIAVALSRRGETVAAMGHATEAGDAALVGHILIGAGGLRLWLREGLAVLEAADRYLTAGMTAREPRLALVHCAVLALTGHVAEARSLTGRLARLSS